jgi:ABC-2 type transport system ATP-binding protein
VSETAPASTVRPKSVSAYFKDVGALAATQLTGNNCASSRGFCMPDTTLLRLENVSRRLAGRTVVEDVALSLDRGSVLGLLGVNGAGKTTTLRMICGVLAPSRGRVFIDGADIRENPRRAAGALGYLPELPPLYAELRVVEYLTFCARLRRLRGTALTVAVDKAIERCGLTEVRRRLIGNLSKGYQQRVGIAQAIVHDPALIVLDEPASGLDPLQSSNIRALIRELGKDRAVILSTHLIADVNQCCDRVAILHRGRLRYDGPVQQLTDANVWLVRTASTPTWAAIASVTSAQFAEPYWRVTTTLPPTKLAETIVAKGWGLIELRPQEANLEQVFLRIASADDAEAA